MARAAVLAFLALILPADVAARSPWTGLTLRRSGRSFLVDPVRVERLGPGSARPAIPRPAPRTVLPLSPGSGAPALVPLATDAVMRQLLPSEAIVRKFDPADGSLTAADAGNPTDLTESARAALANAPDWLKTDLASNLCRLAPEVQDLVAPLMTQPEDPRFLDETAFLLANMPPEDLARPGFRPGYVIDQVRSLYQADTLLDYVQLKDTGVPGQGDFGTTAVYRYTEDGVEKAYELPRDAYYWWVVHPRLDGEELADVRPDTGKLAPYPDGMTFREYYLAPPEGPRSYVEHYVFKAPGKWEYEFGLKDVPHASLNGWGPSQRGAIVEQNVGALHLTKDSLGRPTTIEFKVRPKGIVLATTLAVEQGYADKKSDLLQTMLRYGPGNVVLPAKALTLVVQERPPFGLAGVVEGVLEQYHTNYQIVDAQYLYDHDLADAKKLVVPSDQPLKVYEALAENREKLEAWLAADWRILEIHGAVSTLADDWSGLVMPGGFTAEGVSSQADDTVVVEGQPALAPVMAGTATLWDLKKHSPLSGDRILDPGTFAMDKLGWWASQNMFDSVVDWSEKHPWWFAPERTSHAVRLLYDHYGNCGELQDIVTAAAKTCLVPAANTSNSCEDHVWTEFFFRGDWHPIGLGWSDGDTQLDDPALCMGKKWGGGKNISMVTMDRGDGAMLNRTELYADTGTLTVRVTDADGNPIASASVLVVTESLYKQGGKFPLMIAAWDRTGPDGILVLKLGVNAVDPISDCKKDELNHNCNNYYLRVVTPIGTWPPEADKVKLAVEDVEAGPGFAKQVDVTIASRPLVRRPSQVDGTWSGDPQRAVRVELRTIERIACGRSLSADKYCDPAGAGTADFYLLDEAGLAAFSAGKPFDALAAKEQATGPIDLRPPADRPTWFVLVHQAAFAQELLVDAAFTRLGPAPIPEEGGQDLAAAEDGPDRPEPGEEGAAEDAIAAGEDEVASQAETGVPARGGGGCGAGGPAGGGLGVLALLFLARIRGPGSGKRWIS